MKFLALLALGCLTTVFSTAYATEVETNAEYINTYCEEQAQLAGIEDPVEREEYIKDCVNSFSSTSTDTL